MSHLVNVADGNQPRIVHLFSHNAQGGYEFFPHREDLRSLGQNLELRPEPV